MCFFNFRIILFLKWLIKSVQPLLFSSSWSALQKYSTFKKKKKTQLHTNFTFYQQTDQETELHVQSLLQTDWQSPEQAWAWLSSKHSDELSYEPFEQKKKKKKLLIRYKQLLFFLLFPTGENDHPPKSPALAFIQQIAHSRKAFTCEKWHHSSCSLPVCPGKPRLHPLPPRKGSWSLPTAGSSLIDSFREWWDWGRGWGGAYNDRDSTTQRVFIGAVQNIPVKWSQAYKIPFQMKNMSFACRIELCPIASCFHSLTPPPFHSLISHMTEQLLALSFRRSVATAARSGRLGMCEILLLARVVLPRLTFLLFLLMQASVAMWKMSLTLFSDCWAEHSM